MKRVVEFESLTEFEQQGIRALVGGAILHIAEQLGKYHGHRGIQSKAFGAFGQEDGDTVYMRVDFAVVMTQEGFFDPEYQQIVLFDTEQELRADNELEIALKSDDEQSMNWQLDIDQEQSQEKAWTDFLKRG